MTRRNPQDAITGWHIHVYFDAATAGTARGLRAAIEETFTVKMGRFHEKLVGPHPEWSYQVAIEPAQIGDLLSWLVLNRSGLTLFVHPETGDDIPDHTDHAIWLGEQKPLNLEALRG